MITYILIVYYIILFNKMIVDDDLQVHIKESQATGPIKVDILLVTSAMQNQNGIRLNDYKRYSKFCKNKIHKLRKIFKLTQGKRKFNKIEITPDLVSDSKVLLISLLDCERKWASGMHHKQTLTNIGKDIKVIRYNITRKFKRATSEAKRVLNLCKERADTQTILEAEAYYYLAESNYLIFKRKFSEALTLLKKASSIYESISSLKDTIESIVYKEKINSINVSIRLCVYNLNTNQDVIFDAEEFQKSVNIEDITEKIEEIKKSSSTVSNTSDAFEIKYHGIVIPIKNEKLKFNFNKLNDLSKKIEDEHDLTKKINNYTEIFNTIDDMVKTVKKEKSEEANQQTENFSKIYTKLLNYIENTRLRKYIEKNLTYIRDYSGEYNSTEFITNLFDKDNIKLRLKPQEMIKLYDNLLEYQNQLINLEKDNPDQSYLIDLNFRSKVYTVFKIYYAGLFYVLNRRYNDAYTIMHFTFERIKEINEFYENHRLGSVTSLRDLKKEVEDLHRYTVFVIDTAFVKMQKTPKADLSSNDKMIIDDMNTNKRKGVKLSAWMFDEMKNTEGHLTKEKFDFFKDTVKISFEEYQDAIEKINYNNHTHLIQAPPNLKLLDPKPIVYDLTYQKITYPDLTNKVKAQKGLFSRTLGYFFGGK